MDFLNEKIKPMYLKYLMAAFGSAMITSIYSIVDTAMVGKYHGPDGTASLAVVAPIWNIIYSLGLLMGIGGSVIFSMKRGSKDNDGSENQYFTSSLIGSIILSLFAWGILILFEAPILKFFGANDNLMDLSKRYLKTIKYVFPVFLFNQMLAAFLRNDKNPTLATIAVLAGGIFNVVGDYLFVFTFDMGIYGAGLATAIGGVISFLIMITHFFTKKNTLKIVKPEHLFNKLKNISTTGFATFFIDVAMGILTILFNRQIMKYHGSNALAIYGPIIQVSTFVQCCAYAVGQASQPIISSNYGALKSARIKETLRLALITTIIFAVFWTTLSISVPNMYIKLFMEPTEEILDIAPKIIRIYSISFILLPFNIFSTYYFQAISKSHVAFIVSVGRGLVISGILIYLLPLIKTDALWFTMPITELLVMVYALFMMIKYTKSLPNGDLETGEKI
jgi:putative MATE family efflux protein